MFISMKLLLFQGFTWSLCQACETETEQGICCGISSDVRIVTERNAIISCPCFYVRKYDQSVSSSKIIIAIHGIVSDLHMVAMYFTENYGFLSWPKKNVYEFKWTLKDTHWLVNKIYLFMGEICLLKQDTFFLRLHLW